MAETPGHVSGHMDLPDREERNRIPKTLHRFGNAAFTNEKPGRKSLPG